MVQLDIKLLLVFISELEWSATGQLYRAYVHLARVEVDLLQVALDGFESDCRLSGYGLVRQVDGELDFIVLDVVVVASRRLHLRRFWSRSLPCNRLQPEQKHWYQHKGSDEPDVE